MKRLLVLPILSLAILLEGCPARTVIPLAAGAADAVGVPAPATVANKTVLDEQLGRGVELAYKGWRLALDTAIDAGQVKGARATNLAALDNRAYAATQAVQAAYKTGNANSYSAAVTQANAAIADAITAYKGN